MPEGRLARTRAAYDRRADAIEKLAKGKPWTFVEHTDGTRSVFDDEMRLVTSTAVSDGKYPMT